MHSITGIISIICTTIVTHSINGEPLIQEGPANGQVNEGESAKLACLFYFQPDNWMWIKDSEVIGGQHYKQWYNQVTMQFTLKINEVRRTDKGHYQCKITVKGKEELSNEALLSVNEITRERYPICEISKPEYEACEMVRMTCITENKSPPDTFKFSTTDDSKFKPSSIPLNETYQCSNETHRWATSEFKAKIELKNSHINCTISNRLADLSRNCSKILTIIKSSEVTEGPQLTEDSNEGTSKDTHTSTVTLEPTVDKPVSTGHVNTGHVMPCKCQCESNDNTAVIILLAIAIILIIFTYLRFDYHIKGCTFEKIKSLKKKVRSG